MYDLKFDNPVFHVGFNFTVRDGVKWAKRVVPGSIVNLPDVGKQAQIYMVITCILPDVPRFVYELAHDPECNNFDGLVLALRKAYPDKYNNRFMTKTVTCIGFMIRTVPVENPDQYNAAVRRRANG